MFSHFWQFFSVSLSISLVVLFVTIFPQLPQHFDFFVTFFLLGLPWLFKSRTFSPFWWKNPSFQFILFLLLGSLQGLARWGASAPFAPLLCQLSQHQSIPHVIEHNLFEKYIFRFSWFFLAFLLLVLAEALNSHNTNQSPISWSTICLKICFFFIIFLFFILLLFSPGFGWSSQLPKHQSIAHVLKHN